MIRRNLYIPAESRLGSRLLQLSSRLLQLRSTVLERG